MEREKEVFMRRCKGAQWVVTWPVCRARVPLGSRRLVDSVLMRDQR